MRAHNRRKRMHGVIQDLELQKLIKKSMSEESLTFEQWIKKHVNFSDDPDFDLCMKYEEIEYEMVRRYGKQNIRILMEYFWHYTIQAVKGKYDIEKLLFNMDADIKNGIYKTRDFVQKSRPSDVKIKENWKDFVEKWSPHGFSKNTLTDKSPVLHSGDDLGTEFRQASELLKSNDQSDRLNGIIILREIKDKLTVQQSRNPKPATEALLDKITTLFENAKATIPNSFKNGVNL